MIRTTQDIKELKHLVDIRSTGANIHNVIGKYSSIKHRVEALESLNEYWDKHKEQYKIDIDRIEKELYNILK